MVSKITSQARVLVKIKKCLKLSASSNANEAAIALRQAQAMMAEYNISMDDVIAAEVSSSYAKSSVKTNPSDWESYLAKAVAKAFGCEVLFNIDWFGKPGSWLFIGVGSSPELACYTYQVLSRQLKKCRSVYTKIHLKRCKPATQKTRTNLYCCSWVVAATKKISAMVPDEATTSAIAAYIDKNYSYLTPLTPRSNKAPLRRNLTYKDAEAGFLDGKSATLNRGMGGDAAKVKKIKGEKSCLH